MVKIIVQWSLVISLGVCRVEDLFDNMGKLYLYMRKHKNPGIQMLFTTQTYRTQKTHFISTGFGTSLIQIKKLCIVFRNSQNRDAQMLFARIPKSMKKLAKRWGRQRKRKRGKTDCLLNRQRKLRIRCFLKIPFQILLYLSP